MDEVFTSVVAQIMGMEVMSFCADYKLADGQDKHTAIQVMGRSGNVITAADGVWQSLLDKGYNPQGIIYYPGDYTVAELEAAIDAPPHLNKGILVFVSNAADREAQAGQKQAH